MFLFSIRHFFARLHTCTTWKIHSLYEFLGLDTVKSENDVSYDRRATLYFISRKEEISSPLQRTRETNRVIQPRDINCFEKKSGKKELRLCSNKFNFLIKYS